MKNRLRALSLTVAITLMLATSALAQQPNNNDQQMQDMKNMPGMQMKKGQMQKGHKMSNDQMMQSCHKNMQSMMDSNAQTTKDIEAAKQSNDPAKMRAALDEAEKALSPTNEQMKSCMGIMTMMEGKHGMCGTVSDESGQKAQEKKP